MSEDKPGRRKKKRRKPHKTDVDEAPLPLLSETVIEQTWEEDLTLSARFRLFLMMQIVNLLVLVALTWLWGFDFTTSTSNICGHLVNVAIQIVLIGTCDAFAIGWAADGRLALVRIRRLAFVKNGTAVVPWRDASGVGITGAAQNDGLAMVAFFYLLLLGAIPGLIFYFLVLKPNRFEVALADEFGGRADVLFRTHNRDLAETICERVVLETGLPRLKVI